MDAGIPGLKRLSMLTFWSMERLGGQALSHSMREWTTSAEELQDLNFEAFAFNRPVLLDFSKS